MEPNNAQPQNPQPTVNQRAGSLSKPTNNIIWAVLGVLLLIAAGSWFYLREARTVAIESQTSGVEKEWLTIATDNFGISFPRNYERQEVGGKGGPLLYLVNTANPKQNISVESEPVEGFCLESLCNEKTVSALVSDTGVNWSVIKNFNYCDAGQCNKRDTVYRVEINGTRYYLTVNGEVDSDKIAKRFVFSN